MDLKLDKFLKIKTSGRDDSNANLINYPYEPTPYSVLQMIVNSGYLNKNDVVVDFGSGKGRVDFFLAYSIKCQMIAVEYDERLYNRAIENQKTSISGKRVQFVLTNASNFKIPSDVTAAYFLIPLVF